MNPGLVGYRQTNGICRLTNGTQCLQAIIHQQRHYLIDSQVLGSSTGHSIPFRLAERKSQSSVRELHHLANNWLQRELQRPIKSIMTNGTSQITLKQTNYVKQSLHLHTNGKSPSASKSHALIHNPQYQTMASIQKLATEPTREHVENIRQCLRQTKAKDINNQSITLKKDLESGIGMVCLKSAAKNGISAKMMCDLLDTIDELYSWPEGKGVIIYGYNGFFCSGKFRRIRT